MTEPVAGPTGKNAASPAGASLGGAAYASAGRVLRKYWASIVAAAFLLTGLAVVGSKFETPIYQSRALLEINPHATQPLGKKEDDALSLGAGDFWDTHEYYETQYKIITSDRVLGSVVRDLSLASDFDFLGFTPPDGKPAALDVATGILRSRTTIDPVKNSRLVAVEVDDKKPGRAKQICDAIASAYIEENLLTAVNASSDAVVWLNGQLDHVKQDLEQDEDALYAFKQRNDLPSTSINEASNMLRVEMQELDITLTHTRTKRAELEARHAELAKVGSDNPDELPSSELLGSEYLQALRVKYQDAVRSRRELIAEGKGDNHPLVKEADQRIAQTKNDLLDEVRNIQGAVERDLAVVNHEEGSEAALFGDTKRRAVDLNMKEIEYHRLDRARDQNEKLYAVLLERMKESDLARMMKVNNVRVVDNASEPRSPIRPRVMVNTLIGLLLGLLLGVTFAWTREYLDNSLKTPDDLERELGTTFLGLLPEFEEDVVAYAPRRRRSRRQEAAPLGPAELVVHTRPLSGVAEAARSIRTNLMFMNPDRPHRKLLVTSAAPAEGKTTVACSIAIAMAQGGQRVCLVDCDLRRPRIHRVFGRAGDAGVTNVLVGEATVEEVARRTDVENLWTIPAGPIPPNPADILHSERFRQFLSDLGEKFDRVIVDSPPAMAVTDSAIISTLVDGTIFVVRAFKTSKQLSAQGLRALRDVDARVLGTVLNAVNLSKHEYSYYYHYYYYKRDGYYSSHPTQREGEEAGSAPN